MRVSKSMMIACLLANVMMAACTNSSSQSKNESASQATAQATPHAKRYPMKGKVVSVDKRSKMLNVDGEAIPDFMPAMVMPYEVKPESLLDTLKPGDSITADVVVQDDKARLENITVTQPSKITGKPQ